MDINTVMPLYQLQALGHLFELMLASLLYQLSAGTFFTATLLLMALALHDGNCWLCSEYFYYTTI